MCRGSWAFGGATLSGCANPSLGDGYHTNDWCNVVPDSCATPDLTSGLYDDGTWWDDCGSGVADASTGVAIAVADLAWSDAEKAASVLAPEAWVSMEYTHSPTRAPVIYDAGDDGDDEAFYEDSKFWAGLALGGLVILVGGTVFAVLLAKRRENENMRPRATTEIAMTSNPFQKESKDKSPPAAPAPAPPATPVV